MSLASDKAPGVRVLGKRARRVVSERLRAYHEAVIRMVEPDSEAFLDRVIERAKHERIGMQSAQYPQRAPV